MENILYFALSILFFTTASITAQPVDTIRIMTWNLQGYDSTESQERKESILKVINAINPDIFAFQGFVYDSMSTFTQDVMHSVFESKGYQEVAQNFSRVRQPYPLESKIYYKTSKTQILESSGSANNTHEDAFCRFLVGEKRQDSLNVFVTMLDKKHSEERYAQAQTIKFFLTGRSNKTAIIGALYPNTPFDRGYKKLVEGSSSFFILSYDPLGINWFPDSTQFTSLYTTSTRSNNGTGCDTTHGNGLKYRYDFILNGLDLIENYIPNSYTVFGNDGLDRRNSSITDPPNQKVAQEIAEALQCASSHLPVYADYVFGQTTSSKETSAQEFHFSVTPNPVSAQSLITLTLLKELPVSLSIFDATGRKVADIFTGEGALGENHFQWNTDHLPQGTYFIQLEANGKSVQLQCAIVR